MDELIRTVEVPSQVVLAVRRRVALDELPAFLGEAFGRLQAALDRTGRTAIGHPFVIYHEVAHEAFDAEVCLPVRAPLPEVGGVACHELPGGPVVRALHVGSYDRLSDTHAAARDWMARHGAVPAGPVRERYLVGPDDTDRPSDYRTEVDIPCQLALVALV